jgi:hypothetical protein
VYLCTPKFINHGPTNLPAFQTETEEQAWLPRTHVKRNRTQGTCSKKGKREKEINGFRRKIGQGLIFSPILYRKEDLGYNLLFLFVQT